MRRVRLLLRSRRGEAPLKTLVLLFVLFIIISVVMEYGRGLVITNGVKDSLDRAVIAVATDNAINSYNGFREGNTAAQFFDGDDWYVSVDDRAVIDHLIAELGLEKNNNDLVKYRASDRSLEYVVRLQSIDIRDAHSTNPNTTITFIATAHIQVPMRFVGIEMTTDTVVKVSTKWKPWF